MTLVIVVGVIAVVAAVIARTTWRRTADERHSVKDYQHTVETMRHLAERRADATRRPMPTPAGGRPPRRRRSPAPTGAPRTGRRMDREATRRPLLASSAARRRTAHATQVRTASPTRRQERAPVAKVDTGRRHATVFVDEATTIPDTGADIGMSTPREGAHGAPSGVAHPMTGSPTQPGGRSWLTIAAGIVAVGGAIALALSFAPSHTVRTNTTKHHAPPRTTPASTKTVPTKTGPTSTVVAPVGQSLHSATYVASTSPFDVVLKASGPCWVRATETSTGSVLWTGTLASGESRAIPASGQVLVELGAPDAVTVSLSGKPLQFPSGFRAPLDLTIRSS